MAASVTVDHVALSDERFERLGELAGYNRHEALGRMVRLWSVCTELQSDQPPIERVQSTLGDRGAAALAAAGLGEVMPDGRLRVRGCTGRHEWFGTLPSQQVAAGKRRASGAPRDAKGRLISRGTLESPLEPATPADVQRAGSAGPSALGGGVQRSRQLGAPLDSSLDVAGVTAGTSAPADVQRCPASELEYEKESATDLSSAAPLVASDLSGPRVERVQARQSSALRGSDWGAEKARLLRVLFPVQVEIFNRVRIDIGADRKDTAAFVPEMRPFGCGDPAERALSELLTTQPSLDGFEARARHVLAVRERQALREHRSTKYLGKTVWGTSFGDAITMAVGEQRSASPARPQTAREKANTEIRVLEKL